MKYTKEKYNPQGLLTYRKKLDGSYEKFKYNQHGDCTYHKEAKNGQTVRLDRFEYGYDSQGNMTYRTRRSSRYDLSSEVHWEKWERDSQGNITNYEWEKLERDSQGNETYLEDSYGYWEKHEYDEQGNVTYFEDSVIGVCRGVSRNVDEKEANLIASVDDILNSVKQRSEATDVPGKNEIEINKE